MKTAMLMLMILGFGSGLLANAQVTAVRAMPYDEYWPNQRQVVTIEVSGEPGPITVIETPPAGWVIDSINPRTGMTFEDGVIIWELLSFTGEKTFRYEATPPDGANGDVVYSGRIGTNPISGVTKQTLATLKPLGIFDDHRDVSDELEWPNTAEYNPATKEYLIYATGFMGRFVYSKLSGDFTLKAKVTAENRYAPEPAGLVVLDDLRGEKLARSGGVACYYAVVKTDGTAKALWNFGANGGGDASLFINRNRCNGYFLIQRRGDTMSLYYFDTVNQQWEFHHQIDIAFTDPVYVGLVGESLSPGYYSTVTFNDVALMVSEGDIASTLHAATTAIGERDSEKLLSCFADDATYDFVPNTTSAVGKDEIAAFIANRYRGFPDFAYSPIRSFISGNIAVDESDITGTHLGEWMNLPATGNGVQGSALRVWEFSGNKVMRLSEYMDIEGILAQLGHSVAPEWPAFELPFQPYDPPQPIMLPPLAAAEELIDRWNSHFLMIYYETIHPDADILMSPIGGSMDRETFVASSQLFFDAFPDLCCELVNLVDLGDGWILGEVVFSGTNLGEFRDCEPTGKQIELRGAILWRFDGEGMAANYDVYFDNISLLTQLGLYPPPSVTAIKDWELYEKNQ